MAARKKTKQNAPKKRKRTPHVRTKEQGPRLTPQRWEQIRRMLMLDMDLKKIAFLMDVNPDTIRTYIRKRMPGHLKIGAPSKRTPEIVERITNALRLGASYVTAARYAGVSHSMFNRWKSEDDEFRERCEQAIAEGTVEVMVLLHQDMRKDKSGNYPKGARPTAAKTFWLSRRTEEFRQRKEEDTGGDDVGRAPDDTFL